MLHRRGQAGPTASADKRVPSFMRRLSTSIIAAAAGAYLGYQFAILRLPEEIQTSNVLGLYATGGAVVGILVLRLSTVLWNAIREFF